MSGPSARGRGGGPRALPVAPARALSLSLVLSLLLALAGCGAGEGAGGAGPATPDPAGPIRLALVAEPLAGDAPLVVRLRATLEGELVDAVRFRCATAAFSLGDDNVRLVPPRQPCPDEVQRDYETEVTYAAAGTYAATVRLIARPVAPSRAVRVLVRGATPTPVPAAAVPGPTIVIATARPTAVPPTVAPTRLAAVAATPSAEPSPAAATRTAVTAPPPPTARPSAAPTRVAAAGAATAPGTPADAADDAAAGASVLPADLYFIAGRGEAAASLARLPAAGTLPEAVGGVDGLADAYDVSSLGLVARVADGSLGLVTALGLARPLVPYEAASPVWSPDGRTLAYQRAGALWRFDVMAFRDEPLAAEGAPLAFSRDGRWLLARRADGAPGIVRLDDGSVRWLPLTGVATGGWLPDRPVVWLAGDGLRLVTIDDAPLVTTLLAPGVATSPAFVRADRRLLVLAEIEGTTRLHEVDLAASLPVAAPEGAPLPLAVDADLAWAPDGRTLAVAGPAGVLLVDPRSGASVPLVDTPARRPAWRLARR